MAVTLNYLTTASATTAPTAAQALLFSTLVTDVIASADADTTATITHNQATSVADLALGYPLVTITPLLQAVALLSGWAVTAFATNTITLTKSTATGSGNAGAQIRVAVAKPHSLVR